jgi:hypothetical protein
LISPLELGSRKSPNDLLTDPVFADFNAQSYGTDQVNSTEAAAPPVWKAFQLLFESGQFAKYQSREQVQ